MTALTAQPTARGPRQDNRRERLMDAAAELFSRRGYRAATVRDIAAAVGMLPGSVYYHFPSKGALLLAVYEEGVRRVIRRVDEAVGRAEGPWARLEAACVAHLGAVLERSDYARVMIRVWPDDVDAPGDGDARTDGNARVGRLVALRDGYEARFRSLVEALPLPPDCAATPLRLLLLGGMNWAQAWYRPGGDSPADIARAFVRDLRRGLDSGAGGS